MKKKEYKDLDFTDDFMFCKILENDKELCKDLIGLILGEKIEDITYLSKQKEVKERSDGKGIRMDVYVEGCRKVYDLEMQTVVKTNLPKRTRFYQSMIDGRLIDQGDDYDKLRDSYIIFICLDDPFQQNRSVYSFENLCKEDTDLRLEDGSYKVFLNANGKRQGISEALTNFLNYLVTKKANDELTSRIDNELSEAKKQESWEEEYKMINLRDYDKLQEGIAIGLEQGLEQGMEQGVKEASSIMPSVVERLLKGESRESIILSGVDSDLVDSAEQIVKNVGKGSL